IVVPVLSRFVFDHPNRLASITRTVQVEAKPFRDAGAAFAAVEGEGSPEYWRREHWYWFLRECARLGRDASETMIVICETFEVVRIIEKG
ncbi:MAG: ASCH domain-containing protein, partial [Betaproteobacteria bacterium]